MKVIRRYFQLRMARPGYTPALCWRLALIDCGRYPL